MTEEKQPEHELSLDSSEFISYSCSSPIREFTDSINEVNWEYRQGGAVELDEAIIIIPDIFDSTNSMYLIGSVLIQAGYKVIVISIPPYNSISSFMNGFDLFTAQKLISKIHLVGFGFGGYLAMSLTNFSSMSAEILSLTVISSYMDTSSFKKSGIFNSFTGKGDLHGEVLPCVSKFPAYLKPAAVFEIKELESIPANTISARIKMRMNSPVLKTPKIDMQRMLIIQPVDWAFKMNDNARPQKNVNGAKYVKIEQGGHLSNLANPDEVSRLLKEHLHEWHTPIPEDELDIEEDEEDDENEIEVINAPDQQ